MIAVECLCKVIINLTDPQILLLTSKYSLEEPLSRAFELSLDNPQKFMLLSSLALLFELIPEIIMKFAVQGAIRGIRECEASRFVQLSEMGIFLMETFNLD